MPCPFGSVQFHGQGDQGEDRTGGEGDHTQPGEVADLEEHPEQQEDPAGGGADIDDRDDRAPEPHGEVFLLVLLGVPQFVGRDRHGGDAGALGDALGKAEGVVARVIMVRQPSGDALELHPIQAHLVGQPLGDLRTGEPDAVADLAPAAVTHVDKDLRSQAEKKSREHVDHIVNIKGWKKKHVRPFPLLLQ